MTTAGVEGAVRSTLTVRVTVAVSPALSVDVPLSVTAAPSLLPVDAGGGHEATPEPPSLHEKVAVTAALFQPAELAGGDKLAVI